MKNVKINGRTYTGVKDVELEKAEGTGTYTFRDVDEGGGGNIQDLTVIVPEITTNGTKTLTKDEGYDGTKAIQFTVNVSSGENLQVNKEVTVTENGTTAVNPNSGYTGMRTVSVITNVPQASIENNRTFGMNSNGTIDIIPTTGYDAMSKVALTVNVPQTTVTEEKNIGFVGLYKGNVPYSLSVTPDEGYDAMTSVTGTINYAIQLQNKTVTPTSSVQTITADNTYDGLGTVTVEAATSSGYQPITGWQVLDGSEPTFDGVTLTDVDANVSAVRAILAIPRKDSQNNDRIGLWMIKRTTTTHDTTIKYAIGTNYIKHSDQVYRLNMLATGGNNLPTANNIAPTVSDNYFLYKSYSQYVTWRADETYKLWFIPDSDLKLPVGMMMMSPMEEDVFEEEPIEEEFVEEEIPEELLEEVVEEPVEEEEEPVEEEEEPVEEEEETVGGE